MNTNLIQRTTDFALHIVRAYVHPGDTVIDATCGNGHDTLALARMQPAQVFAFDLQPQAIAVTHDLLTKAGFAAEVTDVAPTSFVDTLSKQNTSASGHHASGCDLTAGTSPVPTHDTAESATKSPWPTSSESTVPDVPRITLTCLGHEYLGTFFRECCDADFASAILFNLGYLPGGDKALTTRADTTLTAVQAALQLLDQNGLLCITMYDGHPAGAEEKRALLDFAAALDARRYHVSYINMLNQPGHPPEILLITRKR